MKKFLIVLLILAIIGGGGYGAYYFFFASNELDEEKIKNGWHIEVVNDYINIRKEASASSEILGQVNKGEVYSVVKVEDIGNNTFWYNIEYEKDKFGWVFNSSTTNYLKDVNNPEDIASPSIVFEDDVYHVASIDDINYDHLEVTDDKPGVTVSHRIYCERNVNGQSDQYWIQYIAEDASGKTTTKLQKIQFDELPSDEEVLDFADLER